MKTDTTAAEAAKGALSSGTIGSILWKPEPHAQLHFWRTGVIQAVCEQMTATHPPIAEVRLRVRDDGS